MPATSGSGNKKSSSPSNKKASLASTNAGKKRVKGEKVEVVDPFCLDRRISVEESDFQLQYTHHGAEAVLLGIEHKPILIAKGLLRASLPDKFITQLEQSLKRARQRLKGDVCSRLLHIVKRVIDGNRKYQTQEKLQGMVLEKHGVFSPSLHIQLPEGMESPRAGMDAASRIQHLDRMREESGRIHHMHPAQILQAREGQQDPCKPGIMPYPDTFRSCSPNTRRANTPGTLSSMAHNVRIGKAGSVPEVRMVGQYDALEDWEDFVTRWVGSSSPPARRSQLGDLKLSLQQGRSGKQKGKAMTKFQELMTYGSEPRAPELTGKTGGFLEKKPFNSVKKLVRRNLSQSKVDQLDALSPRSSEEIQPSRDGEDRRKSLLESAISLHDLGPLGRAATPDIPGRNDAVSATALKRRSTALRSRWSCHQPKKEEGPSEGIKIYDTNVGHLTQHFLQARGFEKSQASSGFRQDIVLHELLTNAANPRGCDTKPERCVPFFGSLSGGSFDNYHVVERCSTPEVGYMKACLSQGNNPHIMKFFAERSPKLDLSNYLLGDNDLQSLLDALLVPNYGAGSEEHRPGITDIVLNGNKRLSDAMVSYFLQTLLKGSKVAGSLPCMGHVRVLSFERCTGIGLRTFEVICELLRGFHLRHLEDLDFKGVRVPDKSWSYIIDSISQTYSLRKLGIAQTGCGFQSQISCCAVADFIGAGACPRLECVDISGNHFLHEGCESLGKALKNAPKGFKEFDLSHNAGFPSSPKQGGEGVESYGHAYFNPVMHVLESLGETTVTKVAFANCQLAYEEDCILEDSVASSDITHIELSDNPHGEQGLRCLMRMLCRKRGTAMQIEYLGIATVRSTPMPPEVLKFDFVDPSASYKLLLRNPQHRCVLKQLLKRSEECGGKFSCFTNEILDGRPLGLGSICWKRTDRGGDDWQVPLEGVLKLQFLLPSCFEPCNDLPMVFRKFEQGQKVKVGFEAFARLLRLYISLSDERSHMVMLLAMSRDLVLKPCHIKYLGQATHNIFDFIVITLMSCIETGIPRQVMFDLIEQTKGRAQAKVKGEVNSLLYFNTMHSDGHYDLNLDNLADRSVAQRCMVISNWVRIQSGSLGRIDLSEVGNGECLRHTSLSKVKFVFDSVSWQLPDGGQFVFDMVLPRLPLNASAALNGQDVKELNQVILQSPCTFTDKLRVLRLIAHRVTLLPQDLAQVLKTFPSCLPEYRSAPKMGSFPRVEAYVIFYNRTLYHASVVSPQILFNPSIFQPEESQEIRSRLGWIHTFDLVNLHLPTSNLGQRHGPFDMSTHDGWIFVKVLIQITHLEAGVNFYDCLWTPKASFYERGYAFCVPKDWVPTPPRYGDFTGTWHSKPEEINWAKRREYAATFLGWTWPPNKQMTIKSIGGSC